MQLWIKWNKHKHNHVLSFSLFQQFACIKNSDLYQRKIPICFDLKKNSDLHLRKMQIHFIVKKNSDMYLRRMQICFIVKKNSDLHLRKCIYVLLWRKKRCSHADYWYSRKRLKQLHKYNHALNKTMINNSCYR